eukprot:CAMPEP_0170755874 /NCGR_PEP_ID=MMETSP0437-20130122/13740_1 /TAXON_ID=0 /ORGANISM="Sexangularia sp." /LENGTH=711 /DNA_ID=CAMNT_0011095051 /DNA_START=8 /DNA_END=2140 /DNA_ORIENTATION=-
MNRKRAAELASSDDVLEITPLGAGQEVGRSSIALKFASKRVLFDAGIHPGKSGFDALPFYDAIDDLGAIDLLLIFMTHPTRAILSMVLRQSVRMDVDQFGVTEEDVMAVLEKVEVINYHQEVEVNGIKFSAYNAGHVLGAAQFLVDIDGVKVHYTGDYCRHGGRHLMEAELPPVTPDVLVCEATFGRLVEEAQSEREKRFTSIVSDIVRVRRGKCLVPVMGTGVAQEVLLVLQEYWRQHPELDQIPIYFTSSFAEKSIATYRAYTNMMNDSIRDRVAVSDPFEFPNVTFCSVKEIDDSQPCVALASPGMLQNGGSRQLLERWADDRRNGVIICGYSVEGTLAKSILQEPKEITSEDGNRIPRRCSVDSVSFASHVDFKQNSEFIETLSPANVVFVHGASREMMRLKKALVARLSEKCEFFTPKNTQPVKIEFHREKVAKTVGQLAAAKPKDGDVVSGVLVRKDFTYQIMAPTDLRTYTQLSTSTVKQTLRLPFFQDFEVAQRALRQVFDSVEETTVARYNSTRAESTQTDVSLDAVEDEDDDAVPASLEASQPSFAVSDDTSPPALLLEGQVLLVRSSNMELVMSWEGGPANDMIADAVAAVILPLQAAQAPTHTAADAGSHAAATPVADTSGADPMELSMAADLFASTSTSTAAATEGHGELVARLLAKIFGDVQQHETGRSVRVLIPATGNDPVEAVVQYTEPVTVECA